MRDLFVQKGLVSEKRARQVDRELKEERRHAQGDRRAKREVETEERARAEAELEAAVAARKAAAEADAAARGAHEHVHRVRQIVLRNRVGARGPVPFFVREPGGTRVVGLSLPEAVARDLRAGRLGVAALRGDDGVAMLHVVAERAARKLAEVEPGALWLFVTALDHLADPAEGLLRKDWTSGLGPHRVHDPDELRRFAGRR